MILGKGVLKICSKFTGEHPCGSAISIKLLAKKSLMENFIFCAVIVVYRCVFLQNLLSHR